VRRQPVDRVPYAFWRHFPAVDRSPAGLAQAVLRFHERYGPDLLVVLPPAGYAAEAWGCVEGDTPGPEGERPCAACAVRLPGDWARIRPLDPEAPGFLGVLETVVRLGFDRRVGDAPVLLALPSPLAVVARLGGPRLGEDLRERPAAVAGALDAVAGTLVRFGERILAEGVSGLLYGVPTAPGWLAEGAGEIGPGGAWDRQVLAALRPRASLLLVHAAGEAPALERLAGLPADAWSWDTRRTGPPLAAGLARVPGAVVGGLDRWGTLHAGTPEAAAAEARDAVRETGGIGLVVGAGGPIPPHTPDATLAAVVKALGGPLRPVLGVSGLAR
jgi:uroporphyrinogen decarboxylase